MLVVDGYLCLLLSLLQLPQVSTVLFLYTLFNKHSIPNGTQVLCCFYRALRAQDSNRCLLKQITTRKLHIFHHHLLNGRLYYTYPETMLFDQLVQDGCSHSVAQSRSSHQGPSQHWGTSQALHNPLVGFENFAGLKLLSCISTQSWGAKKMLVLKCIVLQCLCIHDKIATIYGLKNLNKVTLELFRNVS